MFQKFRSRLDDAKLFSKVAHQAIGQKRKYTGEEYWNHPYRVMLKVAEVTGDEDALIVALLHDTVEDTHITFGDISEVFGSRVVLGVAALTDTPFVEGGPNRAARKALDRDRLASAEGWIQTVKVADMIDNTKTIVEHDPNFAKVYLEEKRLLLDVLTQADPGLIKQAKYHLTDS